VTDTELETELLSLEQRYWKAIQEKDTDAAMRLTADPCIVTGSQGAASIDRKSLAAMIQSGEWSLERFELEGAQVLRLTEDVAVIAYRVHEELTVEGKPVAFDAADTSTWVRRNGAWRCALHTESVLGDPFGRDRRR
jgi:ketosteroid isomerase-like protein